MMTSPLRNCHRPISDFRFIMACVSRQTALPKGTQAGSGRLFQLFEHACGRAALPPPLRAPRCKLCAIRRFCQGSRRGREEGRRGRAAKGPSRACTVAAASILTQRPPPPTRESSAEAPLLLHLDRPTQPGSLSEALMTSPRGLRLQPERDTSLASGPTGRGLLIRYRRIH